MLEESMDRVADLVRGQPPRPIRARLGSLARREPEDPFGEVAIGAALEERESAVRQPPNVVRLRRRDLRERRKLDAEPRTGGRKLAEQRELQLVVGGFGLLGLESALLGPWLVPIDRENESCVVALQLDRRVARLDDRVVGVEPVEHPADRRRSVGGAPGIDRAGDDETVDRARHRDVVEAKPLGMLLLARGLLHLVPAEHRLAAAPCGVHHAEPEATVRKRDDLVRPARAADVAPRVRDDHDLELEPLGRVDRQQPNRASALLLGNGLELLRAERILLAHETDEAGDVCTANRLVVPREAPELAQVGEAPAAVPTGQDGQVVVVLADDPLTESLESHAGRCAHESLVPLEEGAKQALVALGQVLG